MYCVYYIHIDIFIYIYRCYVYRYIYVYTHISVYTVYMDTCVYFYLRVCVSLCSQSVLVDDLQPYACYHQRVNPLYVSSADLLK